MARIPKRLQKLPEHQQKKNSNDDEKGVIKAHDPRTKDLWGGEVGLDKKTRKNMSRAKKIQSKGF